MAPPVARRAIHAGEKRFHGLTPSPDYVQGVTLVGKLDQFGGQLNGRMDSFATEMRAGDPSLQAELQDIDLRLYGALREMSGQLQGMEGRITDEVRHRR